MSENTNEGQQDLFDDQPDTNSDVSAETSTEVTEETSTDESADQGGEDQSGDKSAEGTPPAAQEEPETVTDKTGQKLIPEHRFRAALKKASDDLEAVKSKLAEYEKPQPLPVPDKATDPEGHALHVRMEASKAVMMDLRPDYQEVIDHYAVMAESNPLLDQAVSEHPIPAKLAYDIAKKDLEIKDALELKNSPDWKEFEEFKKNKKTVTEETPQVKLNETVKNGLRAVPNLNRATNASPNRNVRKTSNGDNDDDLFKGAL